MADQDREEAVPARPPRSGPRQFESAIEQRIREATEQGVFNNLPTRGKPLGLNLNDAIDRDAWFVNHTMANLGAVPAWMELGKEIDADDERLRWMAKDFTRWLDECRAELLASTGRAGAVQREGIELRFEDRFVRYKRLAEELKKKTDRFNLEVPVRTLERPGIWVAYELRRLSEPYQGLRDELGWDGGEVLVAEPPTPTPDEPFGPPLEWGEERGGRRLISLWRRLTRS